MQFSTSPAPDLGLAALTAFMKGRRVLALSGAGISTASGIPDYRGPRTRHRKRNPIRYQAFVRQPEARRRYWARSLVGWPVIAGAQPNAGHRALAQLEASGHVSGVLTQNVDGLHAAAGSRAVLELHGGLARVVCLNCGFTEPRNRLQRRMLHLNPDFEMYQVETAPDGDAELPSELIDSFETPACLRCGGTIKPDVVFFGENVPKARLGAAWTQFAEADALLVLGSSLTVFSGYRFVLKAAQEGKPVAIINQGPTRGDPHTELRVGESLVEVLPRLAGVLS